jgi:hypothetical protein
LLKQGVDMTDFLSNGYTWNDLLLYEDVGRKGATRAKQALMALRCNANHFRDYPDALPYKKVAEHAQLQPYDLGTCFGLGFPTDPPGSLQCMGDENWTARDCVRLGLNMDDLRDFGLVGLQQYEDLMVGLSKPDAIAAERDLKVTPEHIGSLVDLMMAPPPRQPEPSAAPIVKKPVVVPQSAPIAIPVAVEQEEQEEFFSAPPAVVRQRPVVVAVPKNKFDRHGALVRHVIIK